MNLLTVSIVRMVKLLPILVIALLATAARGMAATRLSQRPVVLCLKWHLVAPNVWGYVIANDRYLFFHTTFFPAPNAQEGILLDRRSGRRTSINAPCSGRSSLGTPYLGGPWFVLDCSDAAHLYKPSTGQWTVMSAPASSGQQPTCPPGPEFPGNSPPDAIGTYWIRWGCELQNLSTGVVKPDPVMSGGRIYDDLSLPSGFARLCSPLRYPSAQKVLRFYDGRFALIGNSETSGAHLLRCGSRFNLSMPHLPLAAPIDSQALAWTTLTKRGPVIHGLFLPDLRRFVIRLPHRFGSTPAAAALSRRTLYVQTAGSMGELWAANLPKSR